MTSKGILGTHSNPTDSSADNRDPVIVIELGNQSMSAIEEICRDTFDSVSKVIKNKVANNDLACLERDDYLQGFNDQNSRTNGLKPLVAKYWLLFPVLIFLVLWQVQNDEPNFNAIPFIIFMVYCAFWYHQERYGFVPFEAIGTSMLLNEADRRLCENERNFNKTYLQANKENPRNLLYFKSTPLDEARKSYELSSFEHDAIMRCLFGLQNKSFDCLSISALVILTLIENQLPTSITRVGSTEQEAYDGHHYVL